MVYLRAIEQSETLKQTYAFYTGLHFDSETHYTCLCFKNEYNHFEEFFLVEDYCPLNIPTSC